MKILFGLLILIFAFSSCHQVPEHPFPWRPYSQDALAQAVAMHKPVVIDFWADWCPVCHDLDGELFSVPAIQAELAQVICLRVDATNQDDPQVQKILNDFGIQGLPTIVFLNSQGKEITDARIIGFVTPNDFNQSYALLKLFK